MRQTHARTALCTLCLAALAACQMGAPAGTPAGFTPADDIPENPAPVLPAGATRDDILWRDGCYYIMQDGRPVRLPFTEINPETGRVSHYEFYCIG